MEAGVSWTSFRPPRIRTLLAVDGWMAKATYGKKLEYCMNLKKCESMLICSVSGK
jgi:hypothetical protein